MNLRRYNDGVWVSVFCAGFQILIFFFYAVMIEKSRDADDRFLAQDLETLYSLEDVSLTPF